MRLSLDQLSRKKVVDFGHSELRRVLGILDLTMLGVGSTIGVGIYVLAGQVSRDTAGPAVTISFLIAAVASLFAGLCYAEFGARVPKAGSAYIYTYVCIGEFLAFIIGWNLILEYVIGTASVARGFSQYVDALADEKISDALEEAMPMGTDGESGFLSPYPDFLSFGLAIILSVALALGVKESSRMNNIFTGINIIVILFVIIAAGTQGDSYNWNIPTDELDTACNSTNTNADNTTWGVGGFAPFGFDGIMEGAATCFFGFVGFDIIATTGEEAINPAKTIPISIGASLLIIFLSYFGVSAVITLAVPYCLQDKNAPLVRLFDQGNIDWVGAKWFVSIGALFGFSASLFGGMFPLPRVLYAMASDGLLFRTLSKVSKRFQTPTIATALSGLFAGGMAMLFNLDALVKMMSIGTLMAYTIVAVCVMLLRYTATEDDDEGEREPGVSSSTPSTFTFSNYMGQLFNTKGLTTPTDLTGSLVTYAVICFCALVLVLDILLVTLNKELSEGNAIAIAAIVVFGLLNIINLIVIARQPVSKKKLSFKVPLVPWVPAISTFINLYLMCNLPTDTWIRFAIWMAIGFLDYFGYGMWNSSLRKGGPTKQGLDNLGYTGDGLKNHQLIIPKIEIQPATPLSSEPSTPATKPKNNTPSPPSPLSSFDVQEKDVDVENPKKQMSEDLTQLDAAAVVVSLMKSVEKDSIVQKVENETKVMSAKESAKDGDSTDDVRNERKGLDDTEMNGYKEPDGVDVVGNVVMFRSKGEVREMEGDRKDEGIDVRKEDESRCKGDVNGDVSDAIIPTTVISSTSLSSLSSMPSDITKKEEETDSEGRTEDSSSSTEDMKVGDTDRKDEKVIEENNNMEDESKHKKPLPLTVVTNIDLEKDNNGMPRAYYSSPELSPPPSPPPSSPSSIPPPLPTTSPPLSPVTPPPPPRLPPPFLRSQSETNLYHSVPTTPAGRRHPFKVLRRKSSFDYIPPCSPDSPHARRVASFLVIPVPEPDSSQNSITGSNNLQQSTPTSDLFQAVDKLNKYKNEEGQKLFTVGSADSLDKISDSGDVTDFLSPRRGLREPDILDPIRERGESKLHVNETNEKTGPSEPSSESTNHVNGTDAIVKDGEK